MVEPYTQPFKIVCFKQEEFLDVSFTTHYHHQFPGVEYEEHIMNRHLLQWFLESLSILHITRLDSQHLSTQLHEYENEGELKIKNNEIEILG